MTDELDPKLQEFEAKLRKVKPLPRVPSPLGGREGWGHSVNQVSPHPNPPPKGGGDVVLSSPSWRGLGWQRIAAYVSATAIAVLVVINLIPQPIPLPEPPPMMEQAVAEDTPPPALPTMRQQLMQMLDEMPLHTTVAENKPSYPVVEIVVCDASSPQTVVKPMGRSFARLRWEKELFCANGQDFDRLKTY